MFFLFFASITLIIPIQAFVACPYGGYYTLTSTLCYADYYLGRFDEAVRLCHSFYKGFPPIVHKKSDWNSLNFGINQQDLSPTRPESWWMGWEDGNWIDGFSSNFTLYNGTDTPARLVLNWPSQTWTQPQSSKQGILCTYSAPITQCSGYIDIKNKNCYYPNFLPELQSFFVANTSCASTIYKNLASVHDKRDNEFIYGTLRTIIPANSPGFPTAWLGYLPGERAWMDGSPFNYTNFLPDFDQSKLDDPNFCIVITLLGKSAGKWDMIQCKKFKGISICKRPFIMSK